MADPLSPLSVADQNIRSPQTVSRQTVKVSTYDHTQDVTESFYDVQENLAPNSPFGPSLEARERTSPRKQSPVKTFALKASPSKQSPRKSSPEKSGRPSLTEDALYRNQETLSPSKQLRAEAERYEYTRDSPESGLPIKAFDADDTCISAFSAVPTSGITGLVRLEPSPFTKSPTRPSRSSIGMRTPRSSQPSTPGTGRSKLANAEVSPTPRRRTQPEINDATTQLLEFTEQLNYSGAPRSPYRSTNPVHRLRSPTRDGFRPATPNEARQFANLLDFDLPPAPTPRSVPTITAHELESVKSSFLSQISSLKATLSGRDAEVRSLVTAKDDAERRVGETAEALRDTKDAKESLLVDKTEWEKRDKEMQAILREVKNEIILGEKDRQALQLRLTDSDHQRDEAQAHAAELSAKIIGLETSIRDSSASQNSESTSTPGTSSKSPNIDRAIEVAVEKVARELHQLYKEKHENKVAALKKSYEGRWERRVRELQVKADGLAQENDELRLGRDATMSGVVPLNLLSRANAGNNSKSSSVDASTGTEPINADGQSTTVQSSNDIAALTARAESLDAEAREARATTARLADELELSRAENGELVAAVEQMLQMSNEQSVIIDAANSGSTGPDMRAELLAKRLPSHERPSSRSSISRPTSRLGRCPGSLSRNTDVSAPDSGRPGSSATMHGEGDASSATTSAHAPPARSGMGATTGSFTGTSATVKSSGLRGPGFGAAGGSSSSSGYGESRIGGLGLGMKRSVSGSGSGSASSGGPRSGIMTSIERMGRAGRPE